MLNGNPSMESNQVLRNNLRISELIEKGCRSLNLILSEKEFEGIRIFQLGGVELFDDDIKYIKPNEILYVSPDRQEFDDSSNFAIYKILHKIGKGGYG